MLTMHINLCRDLKHFDRNKETIQVSRLNWPPLSYRVCSQTIHLKNSNLVLISLLEQDVLLFY